MATIEEMRRALADAHDRIAGRAERLTHALYCNPSKADSFQRELAAAGARHIEVVPSPFIPPSDAYLVDLVAVETLSNSPTLGPILRDTIARPLP